MKFNQLLMMFCLIIIVSFSACSEKTNTNETNNDVQIANPASTNCIEKGGTLEIKDTENGQVGICTLSTGQECEEWSYFRGECPTNIDGKVYCTPESKQYTVCTTEYEPVCAYFDSTIQCVKAPCAVTESNPCKACVHPHIEYYIEGVCTLN